MFTQINLFSSPTTSGLKVTRLLHFAVRTSRWPQPPLPCPRSAFSITDRTPTRPISSPSKDPCPELLPERDIEKIPATNGETNRSVPDRILLKQLTINRLWFLNYRCNFYRKMTTGSLKNKKNQSHWSKLQISAAFSARQIDFQVNKKLGQYFSNYNVD